jgi:hypothetical protein
MKNDEARNTVGVAEAVEECSVRKRLKKRWEKYYKNRYRGCK